MPLTREEQLVIRKNKLLARRYFDELWNKRNFDAADSIISKGFRAKHQGMGEPFQTIGPEGQVELVRKVHDAVDFRVTVEDVIATGDRVVVRWTARGTHVGAWKGIRATGMEVTTSGINIFRVSRGKLAESWNLWDRGGLRAQLLKDERYGDRVEEREHAEPR
jgi:steroid delta-isomerase-like uncharacterized protein